MNIPSFLRSVGLVALAAFLCSLAFPQANCFGLAWIGLVPLWLVIDGKSGRGAFGWGYVFGLLYYLGTVWWIGHVTIAGMLLLVAYLALYYGLFSLGYWWSAGFAFGVRVIVVPAIYVVLEFIRDHALTGFGWASLGHSQATFSALLYLGEWTGVAGLSFLVVLGNVVLKEWYRIARGQAGASGRPRSLWAATIVIGTLVLAGCCLEQLREPQGRAGNRPQTTVAVVQPNVTLGEMWTPAARPRVVQKLLALGGQALRYRPDLIIWPESSFPHFFWELPELWDQFRAFAREHQVSLLVGAVTRQEDKYFNSAILISPDGEVVKTYSKRHLVLFGEYIPFRKELPFLASIVPIDDFAPGESSALFELPNGARFSVLICFEDTITELAREDALRGADFLVNMTNDAWFRDSGQPRMHLLNALFRSAENHRPLVRATNTGESCVVAADGKVRACVEDAASRRVMVEGVAVDRVSGTGRVTFYTKYGDIFTLFCVLGILITIAGVVFGSRRGKGYGCCKKDIGHR